MKLSVIKKKAKEKNNRLGTYHIPNGTHTGTIKLVEYNDEKDRVYLTIDTNGTIYKSSADLADYNESPLSNIIEPFVDDNEEVDFSEIKDYEVKFTTKTNTSKDGHDFSNITDFEYLYSDSEND